ncbi:MAG: hypothetical protein AAGF30_07945 [Pseudomonadota bacterium]
MFRTALIALLLPASAAASDITMIVSRTAESVEVFVGLPADDAPAWLGGGLDGLLDEDGLVNYDNLRLTGTASAGDEMFSEIEFTVAGQPVALEAMSVMVHPADAELYFGSPIEAEMAMSVCTAPDEVSGATLSQLRAYAGFNAYPVDRFAEIGIAVGGSETRTIDLMVFEGHVLTQRDQIKVGPDAAIQLAGVEPANRSFALPIALMLVAGGLAAALGLSHHRGRRASLT